MIRENFGCSHLMVANDHADLFVGLDVSLFYRQGAAQQLVADMESETGIEMVTEIPWAIKRRLEWGLYAKARQGLIRGVTGISDPYIPPVNPELSIDTSTMTPVEAVQEILLYLEEQGYIS